MFRIKNKLLALALALVMCGSVLGAAFLWEGRGNGAVSAEGNDDVTLSEETDLKYADTSSAFDETLVDVNPALTGEHWLIVTLDGKSLSERRGNMDISDYVSSEKGIKAAKTLREDQKDFLNQLTKAGIPYDYKYGYTNVINAVAVRVDVKYADRIADMKGVKSVAASEYFYSPQAEEVSNNAHVWATGIYSLDEATRAKIGTGKGMVVAVLDTGLDISHPAFSVDPEGAKLSKNDVRELIFGSGYQQGGFSGTLGQEASVDDVYYSEKVPFAYDYADKDANVYPEYSAHGTHVAGIIAGADLTDKYIPGYTDEDGYLVDIDGNHMENANGEYMTFTGVAPDAQLAIFKVFSDKESNGVVGLSEEMDILAALEDCVNLGVDVINMSLGSSAGFSTADDSEKAEEVYARVREAGIMLVVAASNDYSSSYGGTYGTNFTSNPDSATVGAPSTYGGSLSVASINGQESSYIRVGEGDDAQFLYFSEASDGNNNEKDFVAELAASLGDSNVAGVDESGNKIYAVEFQVVPGWGMSYNYTENVNVRGKIALVKRGGNVSFEDKVRIAQQNGAIACVIYNNVSGTIRMSVGNLNKPIPACSVTMDAAAPVVAKGSGTMYISEGYTAGPFMSDFSSWGPTPDLKLKPEISAHGGEIISSVPNGWAEYSGTSMASPNMAGAMSLILSYVNNNYGDELEAYKADGLTHDDVALANFLVMSTATIANDEFNQPYSPRKQGAGLADITKAITTQAYLYSEGIDKAKIEIGDDKDRDGVYELEFRARNMSQSARTYKLGVETMTETVSTYTASDPLDKLTVAERAYMLNDMVEVSYTVDGKPVSGNTLTLEANADVKVVATVTLNDEAKEYLDYYFENGMYVEGFVTLEDTTGDGNEVDLNIPWLGFYGDWYSAPMLDISEYDLEAALADTSIPDDEKPEAAIYPTVPVGSYYGEAYIIPLGTYLYTQDSSARQIYSDTDKAAISIYDDETHRTVNQLYGIYAGLLRGAAEMKVTITDAVTGEVVEEVTKKNIRKSFTAGSSTAHGSLVELDFSALERGLENNRKYNVHMEGVLDSIEVGDDAREYVAGDYSYGKSFDFTFYVDTEAPEIVDYRVRYEKTVDEDDRVTYSAYLDVDVYDNQYSQAIALCFADYSTMSLELLQSNMTPIYSSRNSITTVTLDITDYYDKDIELYIQVDDYALNARAYRINGLTPLDEAVEYPDSIEITSGEAVSGSEDYSRQITINTNQAVDLATAAQPADANTSFLFWHSFDESVVRVENGTIFGVGPGTALVKVYCGNSEYSGSSSGILVTVTDTVDPTPSINSLELGLINNADNVLVNPTNATVSVNQNEVYDLEVEIDPWYYNGEAEFRWSSSRANIASVDSKTGRVTTHAEGTATITATLWRNGSATLYSVSTTLSVGPEFVVESGTLMEYHGAGGEVTIPKDLNVYYIYEEAFMDNNNIVSLEISAPCTEIQTMAFANMKKLERLILPDTIEYIHTSAFYGCKNLKYIDIHGSATTFGNYSFAECTSLEAIRGVVLNNGLKAEDVEILDLKEGVDYSFVTPNITAVGIQAFYGCTSLKELDLTQLRSAGFAAFAECDALEKVTLSRYTNISENMFYGCGNLTTLVYTDVTEDNIEDIIYADVEAPFHGCNITEIILSGGQQSKARSAASGAQVFALEQDDEGFVLYNADKTKIIMVSQNVTSFTVPDTVVEIAPNAFAGNQNLTSVTFGSGLETIGAYAFSATGLKSVTIPSNVRSIGIGAFSWCEDLASVDLSQYEGTSLSAEAFNYSQVTSVKWGANLTSLSKAAFANTAISTLDLTGTKVTSLGDGAFEGCINLSNVVLGAITEMGDRVFAADLQYRAPLKSVTFGSGSTVLGTNTFFGQTALEELSLSAEQEALSEVGDGVFYGCASLESLPFTSLTVIGDNAFTGCAALAEIDLSDVISIGLQAFNACESLPGSLSLPKLESLGGYAFAGTYVRSFSAPALLTVGDGAFMGAALEEFDAPSVTSVGKYAFAFSLLTGKNGTLELPSGLESVGDGAYSALENVTAFSIASDNSAFFTTEDGVLYSVAPAGFQLIAFPAGKTGNGEKLTVTVEEGTVRIGASAFENADGVGRVEFPYELKSIGSRAFLGCSATVYEFDCLTAPTLEALPLDASDFDPDSEMYAILNGDGEIASDKYYANFKDYLALKLFAGQYGIVGIEDFGLTAIYHANATGFNGRIYSAYFSTQQTTEIIADDNARAANAAIALLPVAEQINALTAADTQLWESYRELAVAARTAYNAVAASQLTFVENADALYAVEAAMRAKAPTFGVTVKMDELRVTTWPTKTVYVRGEKFDPAGMQITLLWSDGSREVLDADDVEIENPDKLLDLNDRNIKINYNGLSTSLTVTVNKPEVQSIAVSKYPSDRNAVAGGEYVSAGLVLSVTYVDGVTEEQYDGYEVIAGALTEGENLITVSYGGKTLEYTVTLTGNKVYHPGSTIPSVDGGDEPPETDKGDGCNSSIAAVEGLVAVGMLCMGAAVFMAARAFRRRNSK